MPGIDFPTPAVATTMELSFTSDHMEIGTAIHFRRSPGIELLLRAVRVGAHTVFLFRCTCIQLRDFWRKPYRRHV